MLTVEDCNATTSAIRAGFVQVVVSVGCSLVEYEVIQGFLPCFSETEDVKVIVSNKFIEDETFVI